MTAKMRRKHERITEEADNDEQLVSSTSVEYREWQENIKKDLKRPKMIAETEELLEEIKRVKEEKLKAQWINDDLENMNQQLRETVFELSDRCLECREQPGSKLKRKARKMVRELHTLGVPPESINVVVKRVLGDLADFKVRGLPSTEEFERYSAAYDNDDEEN